MIGLVLRLVLDVRLACYLGALVAGEPELGPLLEHIAWRESRLELVGLHPEDAWMQRSLGDGWSTRGAHGMVAAYAWPHVPAWLRWWGPSVLDVPLVSAFAGARRAAHWRCRAVAGCRAWLGLSAR